MLASSFLIGHHFGAAEGGDNNNYCATICISSASSCAQQQDAMIRSFGWSDLPCQGDYLLDLASLMTTAAASAPTTTHPQLPHTDSAATTTTTTATTTSSGYQPQTSEQAQPPNNNNNKQHKRRRSVRFCKFLQVRTYNVTIGSHPWCRGGMALECDWSHTGTELIDLDVHEEHSSPKRRMPALHLNLQKRRARLQEVTGMSLSELIQQEHIRWAEEQQRAVRLASSGLGHQKAKPAAISVDPVEPSCTCAL
jgi:hypothetical protein